MIENDKKVQSILNHVAQMDATEREKVKALVRAGKIAEVYLADHDATIFPTETQESSQG